MNWVPGVVCARCEIQRSTALQPAENRSQKGRLGGNPLSNAFLMQADSDFSLIIPRPSVDAVIGCCNNNNGGDECLHRCFQPPHHPNAAKANELLQSMKPD